MSYSLHLRGRLSNIFERLCLAAYHLCSDHLRWIYIEPDTTDPKDIDVSNAAITLSNKLAREIIDCGINTDDGNVSILSGKLTGGKFSPPEFFFEWSDHAGSVPLQYCPQFHTWGFQPWFPTPDYILNQLQFRSGSCAVLPVRALKHYSDGHRLYAFRRRRRFYEMLFSPISWIVMRTAFRFADNRYK